MTGKRRAVKPSRLPSRSSTGPVPQSPNGPPGPAGPALGTTVTPRKTRRELREERRARRRRIGAAGTAGIVAAVLLVGAAIGFGVHRATSSSGSSKDSQPSLLVSLQGANGNAIASMVAAHDVKGKQGLELLIPNRLLTDVCGFGTQPFGQILALPAGTLTAQHSLSQLLGGVSIDGSWTMSTAQLAKLVDTVGGVTVDVDTDVLLVQPGGTTLVLVPAGKQEHLNGSRAVAFASYTASGEDATAVLSRFQVVFQAVINRLPAKAAQAEKVLTAAGVRTTLPPDETAGLLTALAHDAAASTLLPVALPTKPIDTGGGATAFRVDTGEANKIIHSRLAASLPSQQGPRTSVFVQNGTGTSGLVVSACNRLLPAGYAFAGSGNATSFDHATSQIILFQQNSQMAQIGYRIAQLLRLPQSDVVVSAQGQNVADVVIVLGRDYRP